MSKDLDPKLKAVCDSQIERVEKNFASCLIIDGAIGQGKTTLGVQLIDHINKRHGLPELDLFKPRKEIYQYAIGGEEFRLKIRQCYERKLPVIMYDEGGDFSKRGAMSKFNRFLNRIFEIYRALKIIVILVLPTMNALDSYLFENRIPRVLLHTYGRTYRGYFKCYSLKQIHALRGYMRKLENKSAPYSFIQANFIGCFYDLSPERSAQLHKVSIEGKLDIIGGENSQELEGYLTIREIGERMNRSPLWVRLIFKKIGVKKPHKLVKIKNINTGFYKEDVLKQIQGFKDPKYN